MRKSLILIVAVILAFFTLAYLHIPLGEPKDEDEQYVYKVAKNVDEASSLIEVGFEYVTGEYEDGGKLFMKKKSYYH